MSCLVSQPPRVALLIESSRGSGRSVLHGVAEYVKAHGPWIVYEFGHRVGAKAPKRLFEKQIDGVIARVENPVLAAKLIEFGKPTIDVLGFGRMPGVPSLGTDQDAVGRISFDHLFERGLRNLAYYGYPGLLSSDLRKDSFVKCASEHGLTVDVFHDKHIRSNVLIENIELNGHLRDPALKQWLRKLPKSVGLMAFNDICGQQVLNLCIEEAISVPGDLAVIGVDNDEVVCDLCNPSLSSVQVNNRNVGYQAAAMLDQIMSGAKPLAMHSAVAPLRVVSRQSTDVLALADEDVADALKYIRAEACKGATVEDVVRRALVSPATLRRRFVDFLGRHISEEISRVRIENAKRWLAETNLPLSDIAVRSGFDHVETFCRVFRRVAGQTPGEYRTVSRS